MNSVATAKYKEPSADSVGHQYNFQHIILVTKYRYQTLAKESHWKDCETAIQSAAKRNGIEIIELGVMEDHVHVVVELSPNMSVSHAIGLLKGASSYDLFRSHPNFRMRYRKGHFGAVVTSTGRLVISPTMSSEDTSAKTTIRNRRGYLPDRNSTPLGVGSLK